MYSTKLVNKNMVDGNAYITVGDPFADAKANPFRQPKKGEKAPLPFQTKVINNLKLNIHNFFLFLPLLLFVLLRCFP